MGGRTKRENASLNSDTCSSVNESACRRHCVSRHLVAVCGSLAIVSASRWGIGQALWGWAASYHLCTARFVAGVVVSWTSAQVRVNEGGVCRSQVVVVGGWPAKISRKSSRLGKQKWWPRWRQGSASIHSQAKLYEQLRANLKRNKHGTTNLRRLRFVICPITRQTALLNYWEATPPRRLGVAILSHSSTAAAQTYISGPVNEVVPGLLRGHVPW